MEKSGSMQLVLYYHVYLQLAWQVRLLKSELLGQYNASVNECNENVLLWLPLVHQFNPRDILIRHIDLIKTVSVSKLL